MIILLNLILSCKNQNKQPNMENLARELQSLVDKGKTPSVSYLLFNSDKVLHSYQAGYADVLNKKNTSANTTYSAFSVSKTFTALAILQLAEKGKLTLEDEVKMHISDFPYPSEIKIRHLLTHTAGLPNPLPLRWVHAPEQHQSFDRDAFFKKVSSKNPKVKSSPNEKFKYSNLGYYYLGKIIENVSGQSYEDYVQDHIINPLGIE